MRTVPLADSNGTLPLRASKNPVLGVFRHHCGELASVHQPKGRRSKTRYLICDQCGTDQCGGADYQTKIKAGTYLSIEDLLAAENAVHTVNTDVEINEPVVSEILTEKIIEVEPLQAAPHAAQTVNQSVENITAVQSNEKTDIEPLNKQLQTAPEVTPTLKSVADKIEPKLNTQSPSEPKPLRIGIAAIIGGLLGGLLAAVA